MLMASLLKTLNWGVHILNSEKKHEKPEPFLSGQQKRSSDLMMFFNKVNSFSCDGGKSEAIGEGGGLKSLSWCEVSCEEQVPTGLHVSNSFFRLNLPSQFTLKHIILLALIFLPCSPASLCSTKSAKKG